MPLLDHFHPPLSRQRPWEGIHGAWAAMIATHLNEGLLPADYFAMPLVGLGGNLEVDVGTFADGPPGMRAGGTGTALWAPPAPSLRTVVDFTAAGVFEVRIVREMGEPQLRAALEIVSPANKDRPQQRRALAIKCAAYLQRGISVILLDVVTVRTADIPGEIVKILQLPASFAWSSPSNLYAISYRVLPGEEVELSAWPFPLSLGGNLPEVPLWLEPDLCIPLALEETYTRTCSSLRIAE